ncbi:MAG: hypothetical protein QOE75_680 [Solirubrobacterales bacterium]|nr:hypothetical protein [Solirubrobacterales bacterium]
MARRTIALLATAVGMLLTTAAMAIADTGDIIAPQNEPPTAADGWQAITCTTETPECSPETEAQWFKKAGGHPPTAFTQYTIKQFEAEPGKFISVGSLGRLRVDLPPGLTVNPEATTTKCTAAQFNEVKPLDPSEGPNCPAASQTGEELVTLKVVAGPGLGTVVPPTPGVTKVPVYNLVPDAGEPAKFGFKLGAPGGKKSVYLTTEVAWENDFHESFQIILPTPSPGTLTWKSRLVNLGQKGDGTFITNPTTCFDPDDWTNLYSTWLRALPAAEEPAKLGEFPGGFTPWEAKLPPNFEIEDCDSVPFDISIEASPTTALVDSPTGGTVTTKLPFDPLTEGGAGQSQSHLRSARVSLPPGMGLNPTGSKGLVACSDAQFKKGIRVYANECPAASRIGTAEIETPPLPDGSLKGDIYVGEQQSMNPESGDQFRILVETKNENLGVAVRLVGNVIANKGTGQLTAVFDEQQVGDLAGSLPQGLPQVPFESVKLSFDASKQVLTSPPICGPAKTTGAMEPWARPGTSVPVESTFTLTEVPGGGACPTTLAERKFAPFYDAATGTPKAGAYSPFRVHIGRPDGQQEVKGVTVTLPKGLTGKLAGIPYCSEAEIAAAAAAAGKSGITCPAASRIGGATTDSGTGSAPLQLGGTAYLAGPYKGAPLSMVVVTPAVSGPFDLGTVVVRVALNVNPATAQITAVSDAIPDVFGGVKLDVRRIYVDVDRPEFMKNPTNCSAQATTGTLNGGGADPANPAAFSSYPVNVPYQANECKGLGFKPKLFTKLTGPTRRDGNPKLRAVVEARNGDANIARTALTLPHSLFLDQDHIGTVCTRAQLASRTCPANSVYGQAEAVTPLLDGKLKGPVYLVANPDHELPDLLADLRGQVNIQLRGVIGSQKGGGLKTVFNGLPDVPVKKFILNMKGGEKSLLVNSENTCKDEQFAVLNMKGQNGKRVKTNKFKLNIASCGGKK